MPGEILITTLSCNRSQPGSLGCRTLTFVPTVREFIEIGRSSKREAKNLTPACDNAWFDSRVMSRHHARLWVSFENRALYICDGGSMHGTWVNDVKIMPDQDVELHNDDVLTFGNDVTRGTETFPPLKVTCHYGFQTSGPIPDMVHSMNTFIVPDDDENECMEVADSAPARERDGVSDDSEMGHSTPITSPSNEEVSSGAELKNVKTVLEVIENPDSSNGTSRSPILLDNEEPLVTPRMTPPSVLNTLGEPQGITADGVEGNDDAQRMARSPAEDYMNDIEIEYSDEEDDDDDDDDQGISDEDDEEAASSDEMGSEEEKAEVDGPSGDGLLGVGAGSEPPLAHDIHLPATTADEKKDQPFQSSQQPTDLQSQKSPELSSFESVWPLSRPEAGAAQSTPTRLPSLFALSSSGWNHQDLSGGVYSGEHSQYSQYEPKLDLKPDSYHHANDVPPNPWSQESQLEEPSYQEPSNVPAATSTSTNAAPADREHKTRVSIADILDTQTAQGGASKRKASEMMSDKDLSCPDSTSLYAFDANPTPLEADTSKETYSQDAQPQPSLSQFNSSTQATGMDIIEEAASTVEEARPSKRVKTSEQVGGEVLPARRGRSFVSHTATAIAGALVGSVGTVALLASLPPDFFA